MKKRGQQNRQRKKKKGKITASTKRDPARTGTASLRAFTTPRVAPTIDLIMDQFLFTDVEVISKFSSIIKVHEHSRINRILQILKTYRFTVIESYVKRNSTILSSESVDGKSYIRIPKSLTEIQLRAILSKIDRSLKRQEPAATAPLKETQPVSQQRRNISMEERRLAKGIRETSKTYKSCEQCLYLNTHKHCAVHKIEVELSNVCSRIVIPKTYLGGAFSPR